MEPIVSSLYVRTHESYDVYDACKLGIANNIPDRDTQYATGEIKRGYFEAVFEVSIKQVGIIERLLQDEFIELNVYYDAGTEFYNKKIISLIEPYFIFRHSSNSSWKQHDYEKGSLLGNRWIWKNTIFYH